MDGTMTRVASLVFKTMSVHALALVCGIQWRAKRGKQGRRIRDMGGKSDKVQRSISRGSNLNDAEISRGPENMS